MKIHEKAFEMVDFTINKSGILPWSKSLQKMMLCYAKLEMLPSFFRKNGISPEHDIWDLRLVLSHAQDFSCLASKKMEFDQPSKKDAACLRQKPSGKQDIEPYSWKITMENNG